VFAEAQLGRLLAYDSRRQQSLVHTLEVYCRHGGRKAETARALYLERQTLYYRLRRIQEILEVDLADEDTRLSLHLALRVRRHLDRSAVGTGAGFARYAPVAA
jgi:purine catabolism regulator